MPSSRRESITTPDGTFDAYCALPDATAAPAVLVFQEVFGVNDNIRELSDRLAAAGFLALAPDVFWRIEPHFERKDESGLSDGFAMVGRLDFGLVGADVTATMAHALSMPECDGTVGGVGFCLGGTLAYLLATEARVDGRGPDAVVSYYGSAVNGMLGSADRVECPVLFHYGANDPYISTGQIDEVEQALGGRPDVTVHRYDAGHAFANFDAPSLYDETAAALAWDRTLRFLDGRLRPS
ncbi:dienelactone hydrolase family protein [Pseudonocardia sp. HH130630-07]|uniref:dienelactone hydrolase family protein n=1 Tax=Pseudonocardia sp. HH130630-07 TaxID=1690815 RepID=UPI000814CD98|nr:dienelactone hydrolase family protein [Pseudonocardia sp. HH130630-07]ANY09731.1 carboxymethylenebutenolidase [Pseudonocardia sp. HH130630-07]